MLCSHLYIEQAPSKVRGCPQVRGMVQSLNLRSGQPIKWAVRGACWWGACTRARCMAFRRAEGSRAGEKDASQLTNEVEPGSRQPLVHLEERVSNAETWLCRCWGRYWCLREAPPHGPGTRGMVLTDRDGRGLLLSCQPPSPTRAK